MKDWLYCNFDLIGWILVTIFGFSLFSCMAWAIILYGVYSIFLLQAFLFVCWLCVLIGALLFIAHCINEILENGKKK